MAQVVVRASTAVMDLGVASTSAPVSGSLSQSFAGTSSSVRISGIKQAPCYLGLYQQSTIGQGLHRQHTAAGTVPRALVRGCRNSRGSSWTTIQAVASSPTPSTESLPSLNDIPLKSFVDQTTGKIDPHKEPGTQASVFAVFDQNKQIQYIGSSDDAKSSLRILFGRRPELCYFFKIANLNALDQQYILAICQQWISELGASPPGNSDPSQNLLWEKPVDAGSKLEGSKREAAMAKAKTLQAIFTERGLKEEMVFDPVLLEQGLCDILPISASETSQGATATAVPSGRESVDDIGKQIAQLREMDSKKGAEAGPGQFWQGVVQETSMIEWPTIGRVVTTTGVVVAMIIGSSVVLLTLNYALAELSDTVFSNPEVKEAWKTFPF